MADGFRTSFTDSYKEVNIFRNFLSSWFVTRPKDIKNSESIKLDVKRGGRKVAPVVSNLTQRGSRIEKSRYTGKEFTPPVIALGADFSASDLINKVFGKSEEESADVSYQAQLADAVMEDMEEIEAQIQRNIEYQSSQVLQTGLLDLYDENGNVAFQVDYKPKATHFPTVSTSWSNTSTATPDLDMKSLMRVITEDGKASVKNIIFGETALANYIRNDDVRSKFDLRRLESGTFDPNEINPDADFLGDILIENKRVAAWAYEGQYEDPANPGTIVDFVETDKVIMLPDKGATNVDFRLVWCVVPTITGIDPRFAGFVPSRMNLGNRQFTPRVFTDGNADALIVELKARPLVIPVSIDSYGCLDTQI
jgi:hypothetical protein